MCECDRRAMPVHASHTWCVEQTAVGALVCVRMHFHRPLMFNGASLLLTADVGSIMRDRMFLRLQPHDDDEATLRVLSRSLRVATVRMDPVQVLQLIGMRLFG